MPFPGKASLWQGYEMREFSLDQRTCRVVRPKQAAPGRPWVWRAVLGSRTPNRPSHVGKGLHAAYCRRANLFGSPDAVRRWNRFHRMMTEDHSLSKKYALEGMSRGGLIIYNWAKQNPNVRFASMPMLRF